MPVLKEPWLLIYFQVQFKELVFSFTALNHRLSILLSLSTRGEGTGRTKFEGWKTLKPNADSGLPGVLLGFYCLEASCRCSGQHVAFRSYKPQSSFILEETSSKRDPLPCSHKFYHFFFSSSRPGQAGQINIPWSPQEFFPENVRALNSCKSLFCARYHQSNWKCESWTTLQFLGRSISISKEWLRWGWKAMDWLPPPPAYSQLEEKNLKTSRVTLLNSNHQRKMHFSTVSSQPKPTPHSLLPEALD